MPWRLQPRAIPLPEQTAVAFSDIHNCHRDFQINDWREFLSGGGSLVLPRSRPIPLMSKQTFTPQHSPDGYSGQKRSRIFLPKSPTQRRSPPFHAPTFLRRTPENITEINTAVIWCKRTQFTSELIVITQKGGDNHGDLVHQLPSLIMGIEVAQRPP